MGDPSAGSHKKAGKRGQADDAACLFGAVTLAAAKHGPYRSSGGVFHSGVLYIQPGGVRKRPAQRTVTYTLGIANGSRLPHVHTFLLYLVQTVIRPHQHPCIAVINFSNT